MGKMKELEIELLDQLEDKYEPEWCESTDGDADEETLVGTSGTLSIGDLLAGCTMPDSNNNNILASEIHELISTFLTEEHIDLGAQHEIKVETLTQSILDKVDEWTIPC